MNYKTFLTLVPILFVFYCEQSIAQDTSHPIIIHDPLITKPLKYSIGLYGSVDYSSNSVTSDFAGNFILGNYLDNNLKQQVSTNLQNSNRFGYSLDYGIYAFSHNDSIGKKTFDFYVAVKHRAYVNATFTPDVFNLAFYGNAAYAGKTAVLSPSNYNDLNYQQIEVGSLCTNIFGKAKLGLGLSFLAGQQMQSLNVQQGTFYTDTYGEYVTLNSNTQFNQTDTTNGTGKFINGYGGSLDINFSTPYKIGKRRGWFSASLTDLGFIKWNNRSLAYNKDTTYTYSGITINGLNDLQNATINNLSKDSLQNKYLPEKKESITTYIPATLNVNLNTEFKTIILEAGYRYIFNANYTGYYYLQCDKFFSHRWMLALQAGYGGYGTYNLNLDISKSIKKAEISLNINHLQGMILPGTFGGAGVFIKVNHSFF